VITPEGYHGVFRELYHSGPTPAIPADWSLGTFLGNPSFSRPFWFPALERTAPSEGLANEFWYYLLFPLGLTIFMTGKWSNRVIALILVAGIVSFLPKSILSGGVIWLLGAVVFFLIRKDSIRDMANNPVLVLLGLLLTIGTLIASRTGNMGEGADLAIGVGCAVLVAGISIESIIEPHLQHDLGWNVRDLL